jgi:protease I
MTGPKLEGVRIAIIATDGVEQAELCEPRKALEDAGAMTELISLAEGTIQAMNHDEKADMLEVDKAIEHALADDYEALLIPGGVANPDKLRTDEKTVAFVSEFFEAGKPIAAICHGPWMLVEADVVRGRKLTSWPSLQTDIRNAGGTWVDREVVTDNGLVTSRNPGDIPAFTEKMIEEFREGVHRRYAEQAVAGS